MNFKSVLSYVSWLGRYSNSVANPKALARGLEVTGWLLKNLLFALELLLLKRN